MYEFIHTHTHLHTHTRTYIHTCMHACLHLQPPRYSNINDITLCVNPFRYLPIFDQGFIDKYASLELELHAGVLPAHEYSLVRRTVGDFASGVPQNGWWTEVSTEMMPTNGSVMPIKIYPVGFTGQGLV